jgi:hypothetical protein
MTVAVLASEAKQSRSFLHGALDCFVAEPVLGRRGAPIRVLLAMTLLVATFVADAVLATPALAAGPAELITQFRAQHGETKVTLDPTLTSIAQEQAAAMAAKETLDHDVAGSFTKRAARSNAGRAAENIAYGYPDFPNTLKQWIASPSHRRNLLLKGASKIGVASVRSASGRTYWAMVIAGDYEKPQPKPKAQPKGKPGGQPAQAAAAPAKSSAAAKRDCTIRMLGMCL